MLLRRNGVTRVHNRGETSAVKAEEPSEAAPAGKWTVADADPSWRVTTADAAKVLVALGNRMQPLQLGQE